MHDASWFNTKYYCHNIFIAVIVVVVFMNGLAHEQVNARQEHSNICVSFKM